MRCIRHAQTSIVPPSPEAHREAVVFYSDQEESDARRPGVPAGEIGSYARRCAVVFPSGVEPESSASEANILSIELRKPGPPGREAAECRHRELVCKVDSRQTAAVIPTRAPSAVHNRESTWAPLPCRVEFSVMRHATSPCPEATECAGRYAISSTRSISENAIFESERVKMALQ